jgi:hypothetical protein
LEAIAGALGERSGGLRGSEIAFLSFVDTRHRPPRP